MYGLVSQQRNFTLSHYSRKAKAFGFAYCYDCVLIHACRFCKGASQHKYTSMGITLSPLHYANYRHHTNTAYTYNYTYEIRCFATVPINISNFLYVRYYNIFTAHGFIFRRSFMCTIYTNPSCIHAQLHRGVDVVTMCT